MTAYHDHPPARNLDIYRLVVLRNQQQQTVAHALGITPSRVSQIITRVRDWVNGSIGDWLFPGRDDLRLHVALEMHQIRLFENDTDPNPVRITGPDFAYTRALQSASQNSSPNAHPGAHLSAHPLNSPAQVMPSSLAPTPSPETTFPTPDLLDFALHIARLLTIWKKSAKVSTAIRARTKLPLPQSSPLTP
jgi:hypothetical protein